MSSPYSKQPQTVQPQSGGQPGAYYGNAGNPSNPYGYGQQQQASTTNNTTIIIQQPTAAGVRDWSSGICDCCDDMGICHGDRSGVDKGTICNDCLIQTYCGSCALCQLAREVKMIKQRGSQP